MDGKLSGYRGKTRRILMEAAAEIGDLIRVTKNTATYEGILIPRSEYGDDKHIVIKNKSGYNVGVEITSTTKVQRIRAQTKPSFVPPPLPQQKTDLPKITIISTGGTIASRVDYRTGAVRPAISASDLYSIVPELSDIAIIDTQILFSIFSEDLTPKHWTEIAKAVAGHISGGAQGVVITHGTDTMGYTAAALSFALQNLPVPVILVGAQRSEDRPSSDAALNLVGATLAAAKAPFAEVAVAMHESISDKAVALHRGTKVRKCHTSRRDAFKTVNAEPLAKVADGQITLLTDDYQPRDHKRKLQLQPNFEEKVALVKFCPGMNPKVIEWYVDEGYRGVILEATGLGHVWHGCFPAIKRAVENGVTVGVTSQCIWGRVNMNVYASGRDLIAMGATPLEDMLAETALVKLMWILGHTRDVEEAKRLLRTNLVNEISKRTVESIEPETAGKERAD